MAKSNQQSVSLEQAVQSIIKNYKISGSTKLKKQVIDLYNKKNHETAIEVKIYDEIYAVYRIDRDMIQNSKKRGVVTFAKITAILLFHKHLDLNQAQIGKKLKLKESIISRRLRGFYAVPEESDDIAMSKIYFSKVFINTFNDIDKKIKKFKNGRK